MPPVPMSCAAISAIGVAGAAQDAHEPDSHGEEDDARGREKKISHRRTPG